MDAVRCIQKGWRLLVLVLLISTVPGLAAAGGSAGPDAPDSPQKCGPAVVPGGSGPPQAVIPVPGLLNPTRLPGEWRGVTETRPVLELSLTFHNDFTYRHEVRFGTELLAFETGTYTLPERDCVTLSPVQRAETICSGDGCVSLTRKAAPVTYRLRFSGGNRLTLAAVSAGGGPFDEVTFQRVGPED